ncbi:hypothetical protein OESDEN_10376 [Oesophagostomum dentatum]|uniref:Uncharacterized protein n=1 Tax=Oesophagostomum dentatum TaxID=61180 RepID=A0A0B1T0W5_OESDE|nr:hypothetical protein OESDEN_10376 [Oesophagostomum dentatum]
MPILRCRLDRRDQILGIMIILLLSVLLAHKTKSQINFCFRSISIRVGVSTDRVEYDVSPWCGMEDEQMKYKQNMDQLIPVLYDILGYLSGGFHIELTLSFVSTKSLPCVI